MYARQSARFSGFAIRVPLELSYFRRKSMSQHPRAAIPTVDAALTVTVNRDLDDLAGRSESHDPKNPSPNSLWHSFFFVFFFFLWSTILKTGTRIGITIFASWFPFSYSDCSERPRCRLFRTFSTITRFAVYLPRPWFDPARTSHTSMRMDKLGNDLIILVFFYLFRLLLFSYYYLFSYYLSIFLVFFYLLSLLL